MTTQINPRQISSTDNSSDMASQLSNLAQTIAAQATSVTALQIQQSLDQTDITVLQTAMTSTDTSITTLQSDVSALQTDVTTLTSDVTALQTATAGLPALQTQVNNLNTEQITTAFPVSPYDGMICYRTDLEQLYLYNASAQAWIQK